KQLVDKGRHGPLPRIAPDGDRPSDIYARPFDAAKAAGKPKVSVLLTGLGIGASITSEATAKLPGEVSFAFAPYGNDLEKQVARARDDGHEILLQLPMEPFDYPENDPGPQTLLADAPEAQNLDRLHWLMARFQGYAGLTNFMGARLSTSRKGLKPILAEAAKRGLVFVDDGAAGRSQIVTAAGEVGLPAARGDIVLDGIDKPADLDAALARAENLARTNGRVIVMGPALPMTVERLGRWLKTLEQKGIVLAPVTAQVAAKKG
ncbi:MAG TPA: divergent polysaccharide deacetylase family protein, partial [Beijerinckiaceae bacterium]|nr:divergent polysaccharide deacetylase family protein [Beijerinckiaceae bacterium]